MHRIVSQIEIGTTTREVICNVTFHFFGRIQNFFFSQNLFFYILHLTGRTFALLGNGSFSELAFNALRCLSLKVFANKLSLYTHSHTHTHTYTHTLIHALLFLYTQLKRLICQKRGLTDFQNTNTEIAVYKMDRILHVAQKIVIFSNKSSLLSSTLKLSSNNSFHN